MRAREPSAIPVGVPVAAAMDDILWMKAAMVLVAVPVRIRDVGWGLCGGKPQFSLQRPTGAQLTCSG